LHPVTGLLSFVIDEDIAAVNQANGPAPGTGFAKTGNNPVKAGIF